METDHPAFQTGLAKSSTAPSQGDGTYNTSIGYLRAFVTLLVLAHLSMLAYCKFAPQPPVSCWLSPIGGKRFPWLTPLDRPRSFLEAGPSFCFCRGIIAPLDYYPAFLQTGAHHGLRGLRANVALAGQLACRSCLVCLGSSGIRLYCRVIDHDFAQWGHILGRLMAWASRPLKFFAILVALSAIAHLPMELAFNPLQWAAFGPFTFQTSRILHYLVYFLIVAGVGAYGINRFVLAPDGKLARRWPLWLLAVLACLRCLLHSFLSPLRTIRVRA